MKNTEAKITARGAITFTFTDKTEEFFSNLESISLLEECYGSIWQLVNAVENNTLSVSKLAQSFGILLPHISDDDIRNEILKKGAAHYMLVLLQICVPILTGLSKLGAVENAENQMGNDFILRF